jgi:peptidoglycan LD-endopeptidase LytH
MTVKNVLEKNKALFFPVLGKAIKSTDFCSIPLSIGHPRLAGHNATTFEGLDFYVKNFLKEKKAQVAHGGYGEKRAIYTASEHFTNPAEIRNVHLGVDLWAEALTPVYAPLDGIVHSFRYNDKTLDYGATIILQHTLENSIFYTLYGHLSLKSLENRQKGEKILRGQNFCWLGEPHENGGWSPHLHLQLMTEMLGWEGDFPGVAAEIEKDYYLDICPNPEMFCF